jgi:hypothetical protein
MNNAPIDEKKKKLEEAFKKISPLFPLIKELEMNERLREEKIKNLKPHNNEFI